MHKDIIIQQVNQRNRKQRRTISQRLHIHSFYVQRIKLNKNATLDSMTNLWDSSKILFGFQISFALPYLRKKNLIVTLTTVRHRVDGMIKEMKEKLKCENKTYSTAGVSSIPKLKS